jgi:hypothetical protein
MKNKINKERRRSMNAAPTRPSIKSQWQGAQEDPKQKQETTTISMIFNFHFLLVFRHSNIKDLIGISFHVTKLAGYQHTFS